MATKATLIEHAKVITQSKNHKLSGWITVAHLGRSECQHCGMTVHVNTKTQSVTGPAFNNNCSDPDGQAAA
jgi:hypothetical protein